MRLTIIGVLLAAQWLYGQNTATQSVNRVLYFANTDSSQGMQEITNTIRALTNIPAALDLTQRTLEVSGAAKEIEFAEWVFNELDRPATAQASQSPNSTTYTEQLSDGKTLTQVARVFHFTNSTSPKGIQETVNIIRAISEIVRLMPIDERNAIVLRGSAEQMGLAEWLFDELNQPPSAQRSGVLQYQLPPSAADPNHPDLARIFYLPGTANMQQVVSAVRATTKITRIMPAPEQNALVVRASENLMAEAAQLIQKLDGGPSKQ